jgi:streptogramin lyase
VEELIRDRMHEALEVEQPDNRLRSRILSSLPADDLPKPRVSRRSFRWAGGLVAALLAVAIVAGLLYSRAALRPPHSTATITLGTAVITEYNAPDGWLDQNQHVGIVTVGPDGNLFIGSGGSILKLSQSGSFTKYTIPATLNMLPWRWVNGITTGPDGNIWFTQFSQFTESAGATTATVIEGKVFKMTTSGVFTEYAIPVGSNSSPDAITVGPDGNLWFTEPKKSMVGKMTTSGVLTEYAIPIDSSLGAPTPTITAGPEGDLWFTEPTKSIVAKVTTSGKVTEFSLPKSGYEPTGIAAGPDGNLWVTEVWSGVGQPLAGKVARLTPSGSFTEYTVPSANSYPARIITGRDGNLWFTDGNNVARMTVAGVLTEYTTPYIGHFYMTDLKTSSSLTNFFVWYSSGPGGAIGLLTPAHDPRCPSCVP